MRKSLFLILAFLVRWGGLLWLALLAMAQPTIAQEPQPGWKLYLPMVVKSPGNPPVITVFNANPSQINTGGTSTLSWKVNGATTLNLSPGIGAITGSSQVVRPTTTTQYILTASNAFGTTSATVTVTVGGGGISGGFFIPGLPDIDRPTTHPTVVLDSAGGVHLAFAADSSTPDDATRPAYYAYCPRNCTNAAAFMVITLGDHVNYTNLALDQLGRPRLLLRLRRPTGQLFEYQYGMCEGACIHPAHWAFTSLTEAHPRPVGWGEPFSRFFALDPLGRPRFVYYDNGANSNDPHRGVFYAYCDSNCGNAANWQETKLFEDPDASEFALTLSPTGQPRLAYTSYDQSNFPYSWYVAYAECNADCTIAANWFYARLVNTVSASVLEFAKFALRVDTNGKPRLALYPGTGQGGTLSPGYLHYLWCNAASCTGGSTWRALNLGLRYRNGENGIDLALDSQNRPRLAYHAPLAEGYGLYYTWCNTNCETSAQSWQNRQVEPSERVTQELPIPPWPGCSFPQCNPPIPPCTLSAWNTGVRPSLAVDRVGHPRIAYDADHEQGGGCGTFTDTRLTRYASFNQP
jgi:hypothetical protein